MSDDDCFFFKLFLSILFCFLSSMLIIPTHPRSFVPMWFENSFQHSNSRLDICNKRKIRVSNKCTKRQLVSIPPFTALKMCITGIRECCHDTEAQATLISNITSIILCTNRDVDRVVADGEFAILRVGYL